MKKMKIKIVLAVALLGNALSMQGMFPQYSRLLKTQRAGWLINTPISTPVPQPIARPVAQTWGDWWRSKFLTNRPLLSAASVSSPKISSFSSVSGRGRSYSTVPESQPLLPLIENSDSWFRNTISALNKHITPLWYKTNNPSLTEIRYLRMVLNSSDFLDITLGLDNSYAQTPSYRHLQKFYSDLVDTRYPFISTIWKFKNMIHSAIKKEKEVIDKYEVFYHGRGWQNRFLSDIYSMLYEYISGKEIKDFIFTEFKNPILENMNEQFLLSEKEKRERLVKIGAGDINPSGQNLLLYLDKYLFGNLRVPTSNAMRYVNENLLPASVSVQEIFNMFGHSDAYQKFEKELQALEEEYNNLSEYGELLQVLVPKDTVDECVYVTPGGLWGGKKKDMPINFLDEYPQDISECVLINTQDKLGGLNPDSGIKMFSYNAVVDLAKMALLEEKRVALFSRIMELMSQEDRKKEQAIADNH